jgi:hypothetical protein
LGFWECSFCFWQVRGSFLLSTLYIFFAVMIVLVAWGLEWFFLQGQYTEEAVQKSLCCCGCSQGGADRVIQSIVFPVST